VTGDDHLASGVTPLGYRPEQHVTPGLRIGARVKCLATDDPFIDYGETGIVTNTAPGRPAAPALAFVHWANDCKSKMPATQLEVIPVETNEGSAA